MSTTAATEPAPVLPRRSPWRPSRPWRTRATGRILVLAALTAASACGGAGEPDDDATPDTGRADHRADSATSDSGDPVDGPGRPADGPADRPASRTDTIHLEGMPEPIRLTLYRSPAGFPLPFSTYIPRDMRAETVAEGDGADAGADAAGAALRFVAEFGGRRNDDAFVHVYVFPPGTDRNAALGSARSYTTSRGVPVSQGLEPLSAEDAAARMPWAIEGHSFRYQSDGGWYFGAIGVGQREGRFFQIVRHYPADYAEGFGPRASLLTRRWRWADGHDLEPGDGG